MNFYQEDQINDLSVSRSLENNLEITFTPLMETLFWCAGAKIEENEDIINIKLIRCRLNTKCDIDIPAMHKASEPGIYIISIPASEKSIEIDFGNGKKRIWP